MRFHSQYLMIIFLFISSFCRSAFPELPESLPRLKIDDLEYQGAFRISANQFGDSEMNFSQGPVEYNPDNHSIFIVGHSHHQAVAEFSIPELSKSLNISELPLVQSPLQIFTRVLGRTADGNPQGLNSIGGMKYFSNGNGGELLVNAYEYYDAPGDNTHTSLILRNASDLSDSAVDGYFIFDGGAGHTSGWISPVPEEWQSLLSGTHITGQSSGIPIIGRTSVGPSAFLFNSATVVGQPLSAGNISTEKLLDFSLANPLHSDLSNEGGENNLWTHLSRAVYGLIVPGTSTYLTLGHSGGHQSGVCYKCTQNNGNLCGGYCAPDADDNYLFYWLWDVHDLLAVKNGTIESHDVLPYDSGEFEAPFDVTEIGGGAFDETNGMLYLTLQRADSEQGTYANPPIVVAYKFAVDDTGDGGRNILIGEVRKKEVYCLYASDQVRCKIESGSGVKIAPVARAIKLFKRSLNRTRQILRNEEGKRKKLIRRKSKLRKYLQRARLCENQELTE